MATMARSVVLVLVASVALVSADLPIHCVRESVLGEWTLKVGPEHGGPSENNRCGYQQPDLNRHHFTHPEAYHFNPVKELKIKLEAPDKVTCLQGCSGAGTFTMVYDEGFNIKVDGMSLFTFFHYEPKAGDSDVYMRSDEISHYKTDCSKTRTGWLHTDEVQSNKWSCFSGELSAPLVPNQQQYSEGNGVLAPPQAPVVSPFSFVVESVKISEHDTFSHNHTWIEEQNADPTTWNARAYDHFEGRPMREMYQLLGASGKEIYRTPNQRARALTHDGFDNPQLEATLLEVQDYPKHWDWREHGVSTKVANQGSCGSCYAVSTMDVAAMRYKIKYGQDFRSLHGSRLARSEHGKVSAAVEDIIHNDFYDQGCDGGYPFLVSKYGHDVGHAMGGAHHRGRNATGTRVTVGSYGYVGGYYGGCSEAAMRKEIKEHGPIVVAFNAPSALFSYSDGIFTDSSENVPRVDNWEKTNHAVVAMGWGETQSGEKYWIVKNSWGTNWGDRGYFKIRRGTDECAFESMGITLHYD